MFCGHPLAVALSGDGQTLAAAVAFGVGTDYRVQIWDLKTGLETTNFPALLDQVTWAKFTADDSQLITMSYDQMVEVRDMGTWRTRAMIESSESHLTTTVLPKAGLQVSARRDGQVLVRAMDTDFQLRG